MPPEWGTFLNCVNYLIQNQDFGRRKIWILKRKSRFGVFRYRWIRILGSRSEIREELWKPIFKFSKSNFWPRSSKSKSNFRFWVANFWILGMDFEFLSPKCKIEIEFEVLMSDFSFIQNQIFQKSKFQILAESNSAFSSNFDPAFWFFRVYIPKFSSHLAKYPKYFSNFSSTIWLGFAHNTCA